MLTRTAGAGDLDVSLAVFKWDGVPNQAILCYSEAPVTNASPATSKSTGPVVLQSPRCGGITYSVASFHKIWVQGNRDLIYPTPTHNFF